MIPLTNYSDNRWSTQDKITQYKGLVNLLTRTQLIKKTQANENQRLKRQKLSKLRSLVKLKRLETTRKRKHKPTYEICANTDIRALCERLPIDNMITKLNSMNRLRKNRIDLINSEQKQTMQLLIDLKLHLLDLQAIADLDLSQIRSQSQKVLVFIANVASKQNGAFLVRNYLMGILQSLKTDAIYFNVILEALSNDAKNQARCLYHTLLLGQLAYENLDNRKQDCQQLEHLLQKSFQERVDNIKFVRDEIIEFKENIPNLITRQVSTQSFDEDTEEIIIIKNDLKNIQHNLNELQMVTKVADFVSIMTRLIEVNQQNIQLSSNVETLVTRRNLLMEMKQRSIVIRDVLVFDEDHLEGIEFIPIVPESDEEEYHRNLLINRTLQCTTSLQQLALTLRSVTFTRTYSSQLQCKYRITNIHHDLLEEIQEKYEQLMELLTEIDDDVEIYVAISLKNYTAALIETSFLRHQQVYKADKDGGQVQDFEMDTFGYAMTRNDVKNRARKILLAQETV